MNARYTAVMAIAANLSVRYLFKSTAHSQWTWYGTHVTPYRSLLHIGCADTALFTTLRAQCGYGITFAPKTAAPSNHTVKLVSALSEVPTNTTFDYIVVSGIPHQTDIDTHNLLQAITAHAHARTRVVFEQRSWLWRTLDRMWHTVTFKKSNTPEWISAKTLAHLLRLHGMEVIVHEYHTLVPRTMPIVSSVINRLIQLPLLRYSATTQSTICYVKKPQRTDSATVSVIVPCKNEAGTIESIITTIPSLGSHTQLVFVEGGSKDNTAQTIRAMIERYPERDIVMYQQTGRGKYDAVKLGCAQATGDIIIIYDGDFSVPANTLPLFVQTLTSHEAECVNGSRLIFYREPGAMFFTAYCANRFFAYALSWVSGQTLTDTLCGTKGFWKADYDAIIASKTDWYDPFGDFDILLRSAQRWLKITDIPIAYKDRVYGTTNISRYREVWHLLRIVFNAGLIFKK